MSIRSTVFGTALAFGVAAAVLGSGGTARAGGPLPYDGPTPPPGLNVAYLYNQFSSASSYYNAGGVKLGNTHVQTEVPVLRFVHTLPRIHGMQPGLQLIVPYVSFLGRTEVGGGNLSHNGGFAEPQLSAFIYPYDNPKEDASLVFTYYLSPPSGSYNPDYALNASTNNWVNNIEVGYSHLLFGKPKGQRLDIQLWYDAYFYGGNSNSGYGPYRGTTTTQPGNQLIVYLPYYFHPQTAGYVGLAFEHTWGGKSVFTSKQLGPARIDTGRTNFTRLGVVAGSFLSPTLFAQAELATDVQARDGVKNDVFFQVQVGKIF